MRSKSPHLVIMCSSSVSAQRKRGDKRVEVCRSEYVISQHVTRTSIVMTTSTQAVSRGWMFVRAVFTIHRTCQDPSEDARLVFPTLCPPESQRARTRTGRTDTLRELVSFQKLR